jgi:hypothetical protein
VLEELLHRIERLDASQRLLRHLELGPAVAHRPSKVTGNIETAASATRASDEPTTREKAQRRLLAEQERPRDRRRKHDRVALVVDGIVRRPRR